MLPLDNSVKWEEGERGVSLDLRGCEYSRLVALKDRGQGEQLYPGPAVGSQTPRRLLWLGLGVGVFRSKNQQTSLDLQSSEQWGMDALKKYG